MSVNTYLPPMLPAIARGLAQADASGSDALIAGLEDAQGHLARIDAAAKELREALARADAPALGDYVKDAAAHAAEQGAAELAERLEQMRAERDRFDDVGAACNRLSRLRESVRELAGRSRVENAFEEYASREMQFQGEGLSALRRRLEAAGSAGERLKEFLGGPWQTEVDREAFLADGSGPAELPSEGTIGSEQFEKWMEKAQGYRRLAVDPQELAQEWRGDLDAAGRQLELGARAGISGARELQAELPALKKALDEFARIQPHARNSQRIEKMQEELKAGLNRVLQKMPRIEVPRRDRETVERLLDGCYSLAEAPGDDGESIARIHDRWKRSGLLDKADVRESVAPLLERIRALEAVEKAQSAEDLMEVIENSHRSEVRLEAWRRLGSTGQPSGIASLRREITARGGVLEVLQSVPSDQRRQALTQRYWEEERRRWLDCMQALSGGEQVAEAVRMRGEFRVKAGDSLPPWVRYNVVRADLGDSLSGALPEEELRRHVGEFISSVRAMPADVNEAEGLRESLAELDELLHSEEQPEVVPPGPTGAGWAEWQVDSGEFPRRFAYRWPEKGRELVFERVEPAGTGGGPAYLCAAEVSVGLFVDAVQAAGAWDKIRDHLDPRRGLVRMGPRSWRWDRHRIVVAEQWLCEDPVWGDTPRYAEGARPGESGGPGPNPNSPMNWISGAGARLFAEQILHCRLPGPGEWKAAYAEMETAGGRGKPWNLRDGTWARQWEYVNRMVATQMLSARFPTEGAFAPGGAEKTEQAPALDTDDGILWFQNVNEGSRGPFRHLVGNVAEFLEDDEGRFYVAGASALSAPGLDPAGPYRLDSGAAMFADVGLRLAVTPSGGTLLWNVQRAADSLPWLTAPDR